MSIPNMPFISEAVFRLDFVSKYCLANCLLVLLRMTWNFCARLDVPSLRLTRPRLLFGSIYDLFKLIKSCIS